MNTFTLALASLRARPLQSILCTVSVAAGITLLCAIYLLSNSIAAGFARNANGIDVVVGAKGSPLQLVLSSVYHADIPAGNIDMQAYEHLRRSPNIQRAIPLAFGDNYKGFRMVGTTPDYIKLYNGEFAKGVAFDAPFETVAGAQTNLKVGDKIAVTHGFSTESHDTHNDHLYKVTGVLKPTGTVIDKLLITDIKSVQQLHSDHDDKAEEHHHHEETHEHEHKDEYDENETNFEQQITSIILQVRSPIDRMNMPRRINETSDLMAAVPSYEMARFTQSLGIGRQLIVILGVGFVILSMLMLWGILSSDLALRRYDLAVMRVLGATSKRMAATVLTEAVIISGMGSILGILFGHMIAFTILHSIESLQGLTLPLSVLKPGIIDIGFILASVFIGALASILPCVSAARTDIAGLLANGRG
jgi:putative ABC transport system permease protein